MRDQDKALLVVTVCILVSGAISVAAIVGMIGGLVTVGQWLFGS